MFLDQGLLRDTWAYVPWELCQEDGSITNSGFLFFWLFRVDCTQPERFILQSRNYRTWWQLLHHTHLRCGLHSDHSSHVADLKCPGLYEKSKLKIGTRRQFRFRIKVDASGTRVPRHRRFLPHSLRTGIVERENERERYLKTRTSGALDFPRTCFATSQSLSRNEETECRISRVPGQE